MWGVTFAGVVGMVQFNEFCAVVLPTCGIQVEFTVGGLISYRVWG